MDAFEQQGWLSGLKAGHLQPNAIISRTQFASKVLTAGADGGFSWRRQGPHLDGGFRRSPHPYGHRCQRQVSPLRGGLPADRQNRLRRGAPLRAPQPEPVAEPASAPEPDPGPASKYQDGTFSGSGEWYYGPVTVSVTISGDQLTDITVSSYADDGDYFGDAEASVIPAIRSFQSPDYS